MLESGYWWRGAVMTASGLAIRKPSLFKLQKWTPKRTALLAFYTLALFYLTVPALLCSPFYQMVVLMPFPANEKAYAEADIIAGKKHEDRIFSNPNHDRLHAFFWPVPGSKKVIIYHHGNAGNIGNRSSAAAAMLALGANVFAYDYRGYGKSTGTPTLQGLMDDGVAAYEYVKNELKFAPEDIINYGESIGAGPACEVAHSKPSGGLILQSGIPSLPIVGRDHFTFLRPYPDIFFPAPRMDNVALVHDIHCPISVINGAKDTTVTESMARLIYANANEPKYFTLLKDSSHNAMSSGDDVKAYLAAMKRIITGPQIIVEDK